MSTDESLDTQKGRLRPELAIGASNDPLEHEADRVADQVLATTPLEPTGNRVPARAQTSAYSSTQGTATAPASVDHVLATSGKPLEPALRQDMETRFGHDFSQVRLHTGEAAERSTRDVNANAYTVGNDIVFGAGRYAPATHAGRRLLAHELAHVVQQSADAAAPAPLLAQRSRPASGAVSRPVLRRSLAGCQQLLDNPGPPVPPAAGTLVHTAIKAFFMATVPGAINIYIPGASANPQRTSGRGTVKPEKIGEFGSGKGTPDLATLRGAFGVLQVAEIKPANINALLEGETQVARYIDQGNAADEAQVAWRAANKIRVVSPMRPETFTPPSLFFPQPGFIIEVQFSWCQSGVLAYGFRAHRRPAEQQQRQRGRQPESSKKPEQTPQSVPNPQMPPRPAVDQPGPTATPGQTPAPGSDGGKVIPFPGGKAPQPKPGQEELPAAARSTGERILDFVATVIASGQNVELAVRQFLRDNPAVLKNIEIAIAAILAGAIASDIISLGAAVAKDPAVVAILAAMLRIAQTLEAH